MKIQIINKKIEDAIEMTVEELAKQRFVGKIYKNKKTILLPYSQTGFGGWGFFGFYLEIPPWCACSKTRKEAIEKESKYSIFYAFNTDKELYLWMAE